MRSLASFFWIMLLTFFYLFGVIFLIFCFALKEITSILFTGR
jgi:hypothetical protein